MPDTVNQKGNRDQKPHQWPGCTDIKQCSTAANRRPHKNKRAESPDQRRRRNEIWITRTNAVMLAGKVVSQFVGQKDSHQCQRERQSRTKRRRILIQQLQRNDPLVRGCRSSIRERDSELPPCRQTRHKRRGEKNYCSPKSPWFGFARLPDGNCRRCVRFCGCRRLDGSWRKLAFAVHKNWMRVFFGRSAQVAHALLHFTKLSSFRAERGICF